MTAATFACELLAQLALTICVANLSSGLCQDSLSSITSEQFVGNASSLIIVESSIHNIMDSTSLLQEASRTTLLFGWQALSLDEHKLNSIRVSVHNSSANAWIITAVAGLPAQLPHLTSVSKGFHSRAGVLLQSLVRWLTHGESYSPDFVEHNTLLTPLTVIHHLLQYTVFLEARYPRLDPDARLRAAHNTTEATGFCSGLISAFVVSQAHNVASFEVMGATAIRMAMMCGLVVDEQDHAQPIPSRTTAIAVAWPSDTSQQCINDTLSQFPEVCRQ